MADQYRKVQDYETVLYHPDSPVVVERMRLQHDLIYNVNVLQITFRSVEPLNIYGLGVLVTLEDEEGKKVHKDIEFNYYGIECTTGRMFGSEEDIVVEPDAVSFKITVIRADLSDGKTFHGKVPLAPAPPAPTTAILGEWEQPFIERLTQTRPKIKILNGPESTDTHWYCVCGKIYNRRINQCPSCRLKYEVLFGIVPQLKEEKRLRDLEAARIERERREAERKQREEEERLRAEEEERLRLEAEERLRIEEEQRAEEERIRAEEEAIRAEEERIRKEEEERLRAEAEKARQLKKKKLKKLLLAAGLPTAAAIAAVCLLLFLPDRGGTAIGDEPGTETEYTAEVDSVKADEPSKTEPEVKKPDTEPAVVEVADEPAEPEPVIPPTVLLGDGLSEQDISTVWRLFGSELNPDDYQTVTIDSKTQRAYMQTRFGKTVEQQAMSCVLITPREQGHGLTVSLFNITGCTEEHFSEVLFAMGLTDADIIVAAPEQVSGSAALAGCYQLAGKLSELSETAIGTATALVSANVRSGAGTKYECLGTVEAGTELQVLEETVTGWLRVVWPTAEEGYAYTAHYYTVDGEKRNFFKYTLGRTAVATTLSGLVTAPYEVSEAPDTADTEAVDACIRKMLAENSTQIELNYPGLTQETVSALSAAFADIVKTYPEQMYNLVSVTGSSTGNVTLSFSSTVCDGEQLQKYREKAMEKALEIHDKLWANGTLTTDMTELQIAQVYFEWLCENCTFDTAELTESSVSHTAYGALVNGVAVCDGYTGAYNLLLKLEGITCTAKIDMSISHIWTVATLSGTEYHIDVTWGDKNDELNLTYFAMDEATSQRLHAQ